MDNKTTLRARAKDLRKTLDIEKISTNLVSKIRQTNAYRTAKDVMLFYPKKFEVDLLDLLNDSKNFYLPRINGERLEICPYKKGEELNKSAFNTLEPLTQAVDFSTIDLIIVPALTVDKLGYRLGYGGGYYDRLLTQCQAKTMCAIPTELIIEKLPNETHDIKIDIIIYS